MITGGMIISSVEYPGKISLVIFTGGCILRCPYCHNPELINGGENVSLDEIKSEIQDSLDFIDSVVVTGGEPLIQFDEVNELCQYAKNAGLMVKLDTNGCYPESLEKIINHINYVALDIKAPFHKYGEVIGTDVGGKVKKCMEICIKDPDTFLECRTTYVPGLLFKEDIMEIAKNLNCNLYTIQQFRNKVVLSEKLKQTANPSRKELFEISEKIKPFVKRLKIKTAEFGDEIIK